MIVKFVITYIIAFLNIILGVFIYTKNRKSLGNIFYCLLCVFGGLWAVSMALFLIIRDPFIINNIINRAVYFSGIFVPLFYLLFAYNFPYKLNKFSNSFIRLLYIIPSILGIIVLIGVFKTEIIEVSGGSLVHYTIFQNYLIYTIYFFLYVLGGLAILLNKLTKDIGVYKTQILYIIFATILTFIIIGIVSFLLPLMNNYTYDWLGPIFTLIHFMVVGYLIFIKSR